MIQSLKNLVALVTIAALVACAAPQSSGRSSASSLGPFVPGGGGSSVLPGVRSITFVGTAHLKTQGTGIGFSSCGTGPVCNSATCNDIAGTFTTGSAATTCTLSFAGSYGGANDATCSVWPIGTTTFPTYALSAAAITISVDVASTKYGYLCFGH